MSHMILASLILLVAQERLDAEEDEASDVERDCFDMM